MFSLILFTKFFFWEKLSLKMCYLQFYIQKIKNARERPCVPRRKCCLQTLSWSVRLTPQPWRKVEEDVLCQEKFKLEVANLAPHASAGGFNFVPILQQLSDRDRELIFYPWAP